jgi:nucleotide-binding universal stress UspA family protein
MREAITFAKEQNAELCFVHVLDLSVMAFDGTVQFVDVGVIREPGQKLLSTAVAAAQAAGVAASAKLIDCMGGRPAQAIVQQADEFAADLIVMGTHGRHGVTRLLLGSDAAVVVGHSHVPVLLVK